MAALPAVTAYTDGACPGNPGPGGFGVVLISSGPPRERSGGFRRTTNNRMELFAAIAALEALQERSVVTLHSDAKYLIDAMEKGWAKRWEANDWKRSGGGRVLNPDLWETLLQLCRQHQVRFAWVQGHIGHAENERCHQLASRAAHQPDLPIDEGYEGTAEGNR